MNTLIEIHIARLIVLDTDNKTFLGEVRLDSPRTGPGGFEILRAMCDMPKSAPAYIETFYSESPCAGKTTHKNAAMKKWQAATSNTAYK